MRFPFLRSSLADSTSFRRYSVVLAMFFVVAFGFVLRSVHFDEWLYFKLDQSRDAMLISQAVIEGPSYLPLLGPRVGAIDLEKGLLRVGPAYYYFQYLSGILSGSVEPSVFAYPDLLFGTLSIVMIFLFSRLFLSGVTSLLVAFLFSVSFLGVEYSRFAWNPNPLPFFVLVSFLGLLRFLHETSHGKRYFFLALSVFGFGVAAQLHFFGMMSLCGIFGLFFLWRFRLWSPNVIFSLVSRGVFFNILRYAGFSAAILMVLSAPIVANDLLRHGENTRNFLEALVKKQDDEPIADRIGEAWKANGQYFCLITTAECLTGDSGKNRMPIAATGMFFLLGFLAVILRLREFPEGIKKDALRLLVVWTVVFLALSVPVAFQLRPRFFLTVLPIPFLIWGILFEYAREKRGRAGVVFGLAIFLGIFSLNARGVWLWFTEQSASQVGNAAVSRTLILKNKDGVTLGQLERAADMMVSRLHADDRLYFYVKPEHIAPLEYLFERKKTSMPNLVFETMKPNVDPKARFFAVVPEEQKRLESVSKKFTEPFDILSFERVGQIAVSEISFSRLKPDPDFLFTDTSSPDKNVLWLGGKQRKSDRLFWGDVFQKREPRTGIEFQGESLPIDEDE